MAFSTFQLLYMALAIDKIDGHGLSNTACHERLPRRLILATEGILNSSNKTECFSCKGEWTTV